MNDYTGRLLHDEHYGDLLRDARGGWLIKAVRQSAESRPSRSPKQRLVVRLVRALMAAILASLVVTASFEPRNHASTGGTSADAISQGHTGVH